MKKQVIATAFLALIAGFNFSSCSQDQLEQDIEDVNSVKQTLPPNLRLANGMLRGEAPNLPPLPDDETGETVVMEDYGSTTPGVKVTRTTYHSTGMAYNEFLVFNPSTTLIYPGHVFMGSTIANGKYQPVLGQQVEPITLVNDLIPENGGQLFARTVPNIKWSSFEDTRKDWLQFGIKEPAATTEFEFTQVQLDKQGTVSVGAAIGDGSWKIKGSLSHEWVRNKTHVLIRLTQKLYTISMDRPNGQILTNPGQVDLGGYIPVYVSDVYYGRMTYALVSSNYSYDDVVSALGLLIPSWSNLEVEIKSHYRKVLNEAYLHQLSIGGTSKQHGTFGADGWEGFRQSLADPIPVSSAAPISFTLKYVDDNSVASVYLTDRFPVVESHFVPESKELTFHFRPLQVRGKAIGKKDIYVYGTSTVTLPNGNQVKIFDAPQNNYWTMAQSDMYTNIDAPEVDITIKKPAGMSMKDFLEQEISVTTQLYNTTATGNVKGDDLGNAVIKRKLKDLVFDAAQKTVEIETRRNHPAEYTGGIIFQLSYDAVR